MNVMVVGSKDWNDYPDLVRAMTILIEDWKHARPEETKLVFIHSGSSGAENMLTEWVGKIEGFMRQKGISVKEQLYRIDKSKNGLSDFEVLESQPEMLIVFQKNACKRAESCAKIAQEYNIPTRVIEA